VHRSLCNKETDKSRGWGVSK